MTAYHDETENLSMTTTVAREAIPETRIHFTAQEFRFLADELRKNDGHAPTYKALLSNNYNVILAALDLASRAIAAEPAAWMWEEVVDPEEQVVVGGTVTRFATHWSTGPKDATPLYAAPLAIDVAPAAEPVALLPEEIDERYQRVTARIQTLPEDAPNIDLLADMIELAADLSDIAKKALLAHPPVAPAADRNALAAMAQALEIRMRFLALADDEDWRDEVVPTVSVVNDIAAELRALSAPQGAALQETDRE